MGVLRYEFYSKLLGKQIRLCMVLPEQAHALESFRMPPYIFCMGAAVMRRTGCVTRLLNAMRMKGRWQ